MWQQQQPGSGSDPGPEWLQAGYYQNIPHGEVNWAQLAQQWITMRQIEEQQNVQRQLQLMQHQQQQEEEQQQQYREQQFLYNRMQTTHVGPGRLDQPQLPPMPPPELPPMPPHNPDAAFQYQSARPSLYPYSHAHHPSYNTGVSEPSVLFPSGQIGGDRFPHTMEESSSSRSQQLFRQPRYDDKPLMSQGSPHVGRQQSSAPSLLTTDFQPPAGYMPPSETLISDQDVDFRSIWAASMARDGDSSSPDSTAIDIQMRKQLPAWIREGLEKVEREKLRQQQAEKEEQARKAAEEGSSGGKRIPKWRLEETEAASDGEQNYSDSEQEPRSGRKDTNGDPAAEEQHGVKSESESDDSDAESAEDLKEKLLSKMRYWMTSILMEVTSTELGSVVRAFYKAARASAQPKVLAQSSALASILGFADEERDDGSSTSDAEANDDAAIKRQQAEDQFKMPMLPSPISVSKKRIAALSDALKPSSQDVLSDQERQEKQNNSDPPAPSTRSKTEGDTEKERKSSSHRDGDSRSKERSSRHRRSKSRSRSRSRERRKHHLSDRRRSKSRSRSPYSRNGDRRRSGNHDEKRSRSPREEKERRKHKKRSRSRSPRRHKR